MSTQSVLEYASRKIGGVPRLPPVVGGSGRRYWTVADALAGESGQAVTVAGVVPQAGTQAGVVVLQAGQSATDQFYKDQYVLDTSPVPSNGLVAQWARVSNYVGATRTATIDKPWDFSAEATVAVIQPARIALEEDVTEDVAVTIPLELDLQGHRITGKVDVTAGQFCWIRGGRGFVTNGVQKTDFGLLKIDDCTVSRRDATIYAVLMTSGSNLGRCELSKCETMGRVAGRRGYSGWDIYYCRDVGLPTSSNFDDLPYTLVESPAAGPAVVLSAIDARILGEFSGAVFYSENSITGTGYMAVYGTISRTKTYDTQNPGPKAFSFARAEGGATLTLTPGSGDIRFSDDGAQSLPSGMTPSFNILSTNNFTGTANLNLTATSFSVATSANLVSGILVEGGSDTTGSITLAGGIHVYLLNIDSLNSMVRVFSRLNGATVLCPATLTLTGGQYTAIQLFTAAQNAGAPSVTVSGQVFGAYFVLRTLIEVFSGTVSNGTFTVSGGIDVTCQGNTLVLLSSSVSGGTFVISGNIDISFHNGGISPGFTYVDYQATGGTLIVSGTQNVTSDNYQQLSELVRAIGAGGMVTLSGNTAVYDVTVSSAFVVVQATLNGGTAAATGTVAFFACRFESNLTVLQASVVGAVAQGPTSITFEHCTVLGTLTTETGLGTITWAAATFVIRHTHVEGLLTLVGTRFSSFQAWFSRFNGNSGNNSVTASGSAPTTYRYWSCSFLAIVGGLTPEIIYDYTTVPAAAALTRGNLMSVNAAGQAIAALTSSVVEGVLLAAAAGAGSPAILIRRGRVFVSSDAGVVAGDSCTLDVTTTPTNQIKGAAVVGQRTGRALEAAGTTVAGLAYTEVNLM